MNGRMHGLSDNSDALALALALKVAVAVIVKYLSMNDGVKYE